MRLRGSCALVRCVARGRSWCATPNACPRSVVWWLAAAPVVETVGGHEPGGGLDVGGGIEGRDVRITGGGTGPSPGGVGELEEAEVPGVTKGGRIPAALAPGDADHAVGGKAPASSGVHNDLRDVGLGARDRVGVGERGGDAGGEEQCDCE